jgi:outer membrane protein OmpA-like peptidoglycan-associated protein
MSLRKALLAATVLSLPIAAQAQPVTGLYIGAGAGANWLQSTDDTVAFPATPGPGVGVVATSADVEFDLGFGGVLSVGWGFGNGLRAELEGNFRQNDVDQVTAAGVPGPSGGRQRSYGAMVNVLYELPFQFIVKPYIGAGVGYAWTDWNNVNLRGFNGVNLSVDSDEGNFAYQGIIGTAFPLGVPGLALTAEYRFFATLSNDYTVVATRGVRTTRTTFEADNFNHSAFIGIRYNFGQAAPPPPPAPAVAPAPAPARTYLVFFDFDRADLTARARQIVAEAAQSARTQQVTRLEVAGHADRAGSVQYNQRLSQRRADNVAAELVRNGVPREAISVSAYGETRPLVPTADGVREPQNRRVEIVLR